MDLLDELPQKQTANEPHALSGRHRVRSSRSWVLSVHFFSDPAASAAAAAASANAAA